MPKLAAGILLFHMSPKPEVLLVHPGGPFWAKKDAGAWSLAKGEYQEGEDARVAAAREFKEETGFDVPEGDWLPIGEVKYSNKKITAWAIKGDIDAAKVKSNMFEMEWPPKSGTMQMFPEIDRAGWFTFGAAKNKLVKGQIDFIDRLADVLGQKGAEDTPGDEQLALFS